MKYKIICCLLICALPVDCFAARANDIVEKSFVIKGAEAERGADMLDLSDGDTLVLEWNPDSVKRNCTYGMGDLSDIPNCEELPGRSVKIKYKEDPDPELELSGSFEDETTGSGAGYRRFSADSPWFSGSSAPGDWDELLWGGLTGAPAETDKFWKTRSVSGFEKNAPSIALTLYEKIEGGERMLSLAVDFDTPAEHERKRKALEDCRKSSRGMLDGGC